MKFLTDRKEIAEATNLMKYPVILMDISKPKAGWEDVYEGQKVRVDEQKTYKGTPMYSDCTATIYVDNYHEGIPNTVENRIKSDIYLSCPGIFIHSDFGAQDVLDAVERAQAPVVKEGQIVTVVYKLEQLGKTTVFVRKAKVGRVTPHCSTVAKLVDIDE